MQIRKNTKAYKTILEIVSTCQSRPDREKLIRLYITKAGNSIAERIHVEGIQGGDAGFFYDMSYETVLSNLKSSSHQLIASDDVPGIYFFHSSSNKTWDEAPFEFDEAVIKLFSSLPELPVPRKKEKAEKFVLPVSSSRETKKEKVKKVESVKTARTHEKKPKGPDFGLKHQIDFTNLGKVVFRQSQLGKEGVLKYYDSVSSYLLPYLKDRPLWTKRETETQRPSVELSSGLLNDDEGSPAWIKQQSLPGGKHKKEWLLCNDKEHLLFYVEKGSIAFDHTLSKIKTFDSPDYFVIGIESPEFEIGKAVQVAIAAREIFEGLHLRSCVKTDGVAGLHVYFPLESGDSFETGFSIAEYLCKLIQLKLPGLVSLEGDGDASYGKVVLDYSSNAFGRPIVAPYSLVPGQSAIVATPLLWDEVNDTLRLENFTYDMMAKRLKQTGDPLQSIGKKVDGGPLLKRLEENYSFLF